MPIAIQRGMSCCVWRRTSSLCQCWTTRSGRTREAEHTGCRKARDGHGGDSIFSLCVCTCACTCVVVDRRREISSKDPPLPYVYGYQQMDGIPRFRAALAKTIQDNVLKEPTDPNNLVALTGLSAILNKMFCAIGSPGDAVLIPAPYYPMFEGDIATRNGLVPIPVHPREVGLESFAVGIVARRERERGGVLLFLLFRSPSFLNRHWYCCCCCCWYTPGPLFSPFPGRWIDSPRCRVLQQSLQRRERKEL